MKKLSLSLVVLLYVISLISCSDNQLEGENDIAISFSQEGGVYSIPVSDQAHIEFIQDESTHFYKEYNGQDSISIENVAYKHFLCDRKYNIWKPGKTVLYKQKRILKGGLFKEECI